MLVLCTNHYLSLTDDYVLVLGTQPSNKRSGSTEHSLRVDALIIDMQRLVYGKVEPLGKIAQPRGRGHERGTTGMVGDEVRGVEG